MACVILLGRRALTGQTVRLLAFHCVFSENGEKSKRHINAKCQQQNYSKIIKQTAKSLITFSMKAMVIWKKKILASFDVNLRFLLCLPEKRKILLYKNNCIHCLRKQNPCIISLTYKDFKTELCKAGWQEGKGQGTGSLAGFRQSRLDAAGLSAAALELSGTTACL